MWEESIAVSELWKYLLEEEGYDVEIKQLDYAPVYQAISTGQVDLFPDQWPDYFGDYIDKFDDDFDTLTTWYRPTALSIAVPEYMTEVTSIADLPGHVDTFGGQIVGIEPGSETMKLLDGEVIPGYGLEEFEVTPSSTPAMLARMAKAIQNKEPIAVTLWQPHWAFTKYPIKLLKDPKHLFGDPGVIQGIVNSGFAADHPDVVELLEDFKLSSDELGSLELEIQKQGRGSEAKAVRNWVEGHQELVESWRAT